MLARERRQIIMQMLQERGSVKVADLADVLGVSQVTVRSDLTAMQDKRLLTRDFGGATLNVHPGVFLSFTEFGFKETHRQGSRLYGA